MIIESVSIQVDRAAGPDYPAESRVSSGKPGGAGVLACCIADIHVGSVREFERQAG